MHDFHFVITYSIPVIWWMAIASSRNLVLKKWKNAHLQMRRQMPGQNLLVEALDDFHKTAFFENLDLFACLCTGRVRSFYQIFRNTNQISNLNSQNEIQNSKLTFRILHFCLPFSNWADNFWAKNTGDLSFLNISTNKYEYDRNTLC